VRRGRGDWGSGGGRQRSARKPDRFYGVATMGDEYSRAGNAGVMSCNHRQRMSCEVATMNLLGRSYSVVVLSKLFKLLGLSWEKALQDRGLFRQGPSELILWGGKDE